MFYLFYVGVTGHFVNKNFELISRLLALKFVPERHTAIYLSSVVTKIVSDWNIEDKIINATIDGASNINLAIQITSFLDKLKCITHILNLVTKGVLDKNGSVKILDLVKKCRNLVCTFKHSNFLSDQLKQVMELNRDAAMKINNTSNSDKLPPVRTLKQDVPTRWNSTYIMLQSVNDAYDSIKVVINSSADIKKKYSDMLLNSFEIGLVEDLLLLLLPFHQLTELMSGSKYVTISVVIPGVIRLLEILQIFESKFGNTDIQDLAIQMYNDLEERTREHFNNPMVICATFLDPRYRKFHFIKDDKERENMINKAKNYIISTYLTKFKSKVHLIEPTPPPAKKKRISKENNFSLLCNDDENEDSIVVNGAVCEKAEIESEI